MRAGEDQTTDELLHQCIQRFRPASTDREQLGQQLKELRRLINSLELSFAHLARAFSTTYEDDELEVGNNPTAWLREECHMTSHAAGIALHIAEHESQLAASIAALHTGDIGLAHLGWMANTAERLGSSHTATAEFDEQKLLPHARTHTVQRFRRQCQELIHIADRESFVAEQVDQVALRRLHFTDYDDGSLRLEAMLDAEGGAVIKAAIEPLARPHSRDDYRGIAQRRGDALVELCHHLLDEGSVPQSGGQRPHLHVTATIDTLLDRVGAPAATLETGALVSSLTVQRLACDGTMVRVLLDSESAVVDVGRAKRVVPGATRRALNVRDHGCVWPNCDRPASWTQAHHLVHWSDGGATNLENLVALCRRHHWMVHEGGWSVERDEHGEILVVSTTTSEKMSHTTLPSGSRDPTKVAA